MSVDRSAPTTLSTLDRAELLRRSTAPTTQHRHHLRARIILTLAEGVGVNATARRTGVTARTVRKWRDRYEAHGLEGLTDAPRSGAPPTHGDDLRCEIIALATSAPPTPYGTWSHHRLAGVLREQGHRVSASFVGAVLREAHIRVDKVVGWLHRQPDPQFSEKLALIGDLVAGAHRWKTPVLCLDEKTTVSVRTPLHPDSSHRGERRREFGYRRQGTLSWYGVQECRTGRARLIRATSRCDSAGFIEILDRLVEIYGPRLHLIMDNGPAHTSKATRSWLAGHPRVRVAYTPIHASWANPIEVVFAVLTRQVLKGGFFTSVEDLDAKAQRWAEIRNEELRPVQWSWQRGS